MRADRIRAEVFAEALVSRSDGYKVPLVVLSACQTAQGSSESDTRGIAQEVLKRDIPAVVAMSLSVKDHYASLFAAQLYQGLASQRSLPQAFQQALQQLNQTELQRNPQALQWTIPHLYLQAQIEELIDSHLPVQNLSRKLSQYFTDKVLEEKLSHKQGGKNAPYLFIGRREDKRDLLPPLFDNKSLLLRGQGGIGKTAMAAQLAYRWRLRYGEAPVFFFDETNSQLPDIIKTLLAAFPRTERKRIREELDGSPLEEKAEIFCEELPKLSHPLLIFDNLESFQQNLGGRFAKEHQEFEAFLDTLSKQASFPIIFTARYPLAGIAVEVDHALRQASKNDYWKKCQQLSFYELRWELFKQATSSLQKTHDFRDLIELLYRTLGGNYRALEFLTRFISNKRKRFARRF